ncbi:Mu transposase C-terminal domain-containing protein [Massilia scottii]|uniref:Mu transposase C-terminal domain-containing protein n=1 Tax=Massilia scottii TaxID=3057166 RepID=UPI0027968C53|nr:Mu transposase C-terminal domain-containing protein [Massilia sp. CCM 9029]MDQ1835288.1 DDE-type integrase/transposase/recombinase [Massilia sp. CCM 9029]
MNKLPNAFVAAEPGQRVESSGRVYRITHLVSIDSVFAIDEQTNESTRLRVDTLKPVSEPTTPAYGEGKSLKDLSMYSEEEWAQAQRRFQAIKPLLENPIRTRGDAEVIARQAGVHAATLYKWLKTYQDAGHVSALVPTKRGPRAGTRHLESEKEKLIANVIDDEFLTKQRQKAQDVIDEVMRRARLAKIDAPHPNTVRNRIKMLPIAETLRRRGHRELARNKYDPIRGEFPGGDFPLAVVQIDHTPADIILVDEVHRQPIGRPWLTLAIDVHSRMIVGLYITFEKPSSTSVAMCLSQAINPKREYLAELGVSGEWPVWGIMNVIHCDNAKEFRGAVLERGCEEYSIDLQWRPPLRPHYGGHIERYMGTIANQIRKWPGTTFSNTTQRKGYNSEAEAALTLKEFEYLVVEFIVNVYHQRNHSELKMSPKRKWELGILGDATTPGVGIPPVPSDPHRLQLDFLPFFNRSVQQYGLQIDRINYYDPVLDPYINSADPLNPKARRMFFVRRDPRDISKVYFFDPEANSYFPIPYRDIGHPPMSAWELKEAQRVLKEQGQRDIDENAIFEAVGRMREVVAKSVQKSKAARRQATRTPKAVVERPVAQAAPLADADYSIAMDDDPFAQPIRPFDDVSVSR